MLAYVELAYEIPQVLNTSFWLITSNQRSPKSGDFVASKSYGKVTRPFSATTKKNGKKQSVHARLLLPQVATHFAGSYTFLVLRSQTT